MRPSGWVGSPDRVEAVGGPHAVAQAAARHGVAAALGRHLGLACGCVLASARLLCDLSQLWRLPGLCVGCRLGAREQCRAATCACAGGAVVDCAVLLLKQLKARYLHRVATVVNRSLVVTLMRQILLLPTLVLLIEAGRV